MSEQTVDVIERLYRDKDALLEENKRLREQLEHARHGLAGFHEKNAELRNQLVKARVALKPFADEAAHIKDTAKDTWLITHVAFTVKEFRAALSAYTDDLGDK